MAHCRLLFQWQDEHPGGFEALQKYAGGDATAGFEKIIEHEENPEELKRLLAKCYVGNVEAFSGPSDVGPPPPENKFGNVVGEHVNNWPFYLIGVSVVVGMIALEAYYHAQV